ncbi:MULTISPECIES: carboxymuconolactone decarboxylase family protein [Nocardiaceae]|uniref:carboxymuconolactone decarboxylase family protein n=1 Tax=Nocardiaceae TaxID=85025 RepID=UPI0005230A88|nr:MULTISPECIES: carboxymuconolactone decarboxylase family protein [Rhodococcus]OZD15303.1 carboxymuconolactone decarboxylase family protein [Rhodococcus sp. 06-156-4C]OZD19609.1 carboxymuconolactone decarboxylase family protein [Rhodococcus sp. 06-156-4a]OZD23079.1 carboxymuconolactone decarboxylase family protein [Rhodococcus sp. 06-156-3C]OZD25628.1 carboxymuconolactone decarboxylase family protein [Rhodococcus sp. 06-156-3b]OZD37835.1 carboxymuconolactone decarboxylase family protein [Rhod
MTTPRLSTPRIPTGTFKELGPINWALCRILSKVAGTPDAHLFSTLGRNRGLFRGWLFFSGRLMPGGRISKKETELVINRVAHLRDCGYEMDHHSRIGRRFGVTKELLAQVKEGPESPGLTPRYRTILTATDELLKTKNLSDQTWTLLAQEFDERQLIEFLLLVSQYDGLATTIGTLRIERDF